MTICIAAMCQERLPDGQKMELVVVASDRKYTAGSFTYEPAQTKWYYFSNDILGLIAGDASESVAICNGAARRVGPIILEQTSVEQIAHAHAAAFSEYRRAQAERHLLKPLGLSLDTYGSASREQVERLEDQLQRWQLADSAIVTGVDINGAHIWRVDDPGEPTCHDSIGFAAIGSGATHAAAVFMRAQYERGWPVGRAALLTYQAKKAAEVDPYVGHETDMCILSYASPNAPGINEQLRQQLEAVHARLITDELEARKNADETIEKWIETVIREPQRKALQQGGIEATDDQGGVHSGSEEGEPPD